MEWVVKALTKRRNGKAADQQGLVHEMLVTGWVKLKLKGSILKCNKTKRNDRQFDEKSSCYAIQQNCYPLEHKSHTSSKLPKDHVENCTNNAAGSKSAVIYLQILTIMTMILTLC